LAIWALKLGARLASAAAHAVFSLLCSVVRTHDGSSMPVTPHLAQTTLLLKYGTSPFGRVSVVWVFWTGISLN
jgi:hypothetical protein